MILYRRVESFFFAKREADVNFLGAFRIFTGLFCVVHFLAIAADFSKFYSSTAIIPADLGSVYGNISFLPDLASLENYVAVQFQWSEQQFIFIWGGIYVIAGILLVAGLFTRFAAIVLWIMQLILTKATSPIFAYGADAYTSIALFYCVVFPLSGDKSAVDYQLFNYNTAEPGLYRKILQVHLCIAYFSSGIEKLMGQNWWNGEAIWKAMHLPLFTSLFNVKPDFLAAFPSLVVLSGCFTVVIEVLYGVFMWIDKTRPIWLISIIILHTAIFTFLGLYFFSILMILLNISAWADLSNLSYRSGIGGYR